MAATVLGQALAQASRDQPGEDNRAGPVPSSPSSPPPQQGSPATKTQKQPGERAQSRQKKRQVIARSCVDGNGEWEIEVRSEDDPEEQRQEAGAAVVKSKSSKDGSVDSRKATSDNSPMVLKSAKSRVPTGFPVLEDSSMDSRKATSDSSPMVLKSAKSRVPTGFPVPEDGRAEADKVTCDGSPVALKSAKSRVPTGFPSPEDGRLEADKETSDGSPAVLKSAKSRVPTGYAYPEEAGQSTSDGTPGSSKTVYRVPKDVIAQGIHVADSVQGGLLGFTFPDDPEDSDDACNELGAAANASAPLLRSHEGAGDAMPKLAAMLVTPAEPASGGAGLEGRLLAIEAKLDMLLAKADGKCEGLRPLTGALVRGRQRGPRPEGRTVRFASRVSTDSDKPEDDLEGKSRDDVADKWEEKSRCSERSRSSMNSKNSSTSTATRASHWTTVSTRSKTKASEIASRIAERVHEKEDKAAELQQVQESRATTASQLPARFASEQPSQWAWLVELLDDPNSSKCAYNLNQCYKYFISMSVLVAGFSNCWEVGIHDSAGMTTLSVTIELVFLLEVVLRAAISPRPRLTSFASSPFNWFDMLAAAPLLLRLYGCISAEYEGGQRGFTETVLLCAVPILRLLKFLRHFETFRMLVKAIVITSECLPMLLYTMALLTLTFSTAVFLAEPRDNIQSWQHAIWFSIVTMTTVGYGDVSPTTTAGYVATSILIITGMLFMAIPIGIIGSTFQSVWESRDRVLLIARTHAALRRWDYTGDDIQLLFEHIDPSGCGKLEVDRFTELLKEMKIGLPEDRIQKLFEYFDKDDSGTIDHQEFVKLIFPTDRLAWHRRSLRNSLSLVPSYLQKSTTE